ncbi:hypothetical protein EZV62_008343 [Acer yangbiense]|uniref:Jacalin-type lectin domain-containing protein n=1 Tax=Acer yangbiense TaxID=1000413 RepID=A0A5C7IDC8_9ROSI|nr:hypothetical protein EZV62_008343 [Acer yangbiense]
MHVDLVAINTIQEKPTLLVQIDQQQQLYKVFDIQQMANQQARICFSGTIVIGPWGGEGGRFRQFVPGTTRSIKEIQIGNDEVVDYLKFESQDGRAEAWGSGVVRDAVPINLPSEYLTSISGTTTKNNDKKKVAVESLTFYTNVNNVGYGPFGRDPTTGDAFSIPMGNAEVVGFSGRAVEQINAIGIYVIPRPN